MAAPTLLSPSLGLAPAGALQAAFKSAPGRFVLSPPYRIEAGCDRRPCLCRLKPPSMAVSPMHRDCVRRLQGRSTPRSSPTPLPRDRLPGSCQLGC
ncbi:hypothetical protein DKC05_28170 [Serratia marcescens]|uniref:Uncharacterized protein n=1 Tax=Serratia marcescens TaxID=615 RepID=A0AB33FVS2_SERMA|nr:hypothetical protein DKC05_28170 [Serratia marcescens]